MLDPKPHDAKIVICGKHLRDLRNATWNLHPHKTAVTKRRGLKSPDLPSFLPTSTVVRDCGVVSMATFVNPYITRLAEVAGVVLEATPDDTLEQRLAHHLARFKYCFLEFGSGSGGHLIELAATNPDTLCIGCELRYKRAFRTAEKARQRDLSNLLVLRMDARATPDLFPPASLDKVYMNFPDPWEKLRWRKHRMASERLLLALTTLLKPNGVFRHKTDHGDLHHDLTKILPGSGFTVTKSTLDLYQSEWLTGNIPSEFERLFLSQGLPIFFLEAAKSR
jgi:tRNA (guanine-N7-)-methyltransferase